MFKKILACVGISLMASQAVAADNVTLNNPDNILVMQLSYGDVHIQMRPDLAPKHVERIKELVSEGFYDGVVFHRVIEGFMAQTGDPTGTGMGGSGQNIKAEFSDVTHKRGMVSMARPSNIHGADSQFFIVLEDSNFLDNQYTVWGEVIEGMEYVDMIKKGDRADNGKVDNPDRIITMKLMASASSDDAVMEEAADE